MENDMEGVYWCNICSKMVNPMTEAENKCPICETQFTDVMDSIRDQNYGTDLRSTWVFSLYAPIFLGLMGAMIPSLASISSQESSSSRREEEVEQERENELVLARRRRRTSTFATHPFRGLHFRMVSESENSENNRNIDRSILVIDPFNESALILRGPNFSHTSSPNENAVGIGSLSDFLVGSGLDLLLQHLAQNSPSGYASVNPPAQKTAIEALPCVTSEEKLQCTVCLEDVDIGSEAKEMPCMHKFHTDCITSWLKLHSTCPVCRFQMPSEGSTTVEANLEIGNQVNQNSVLVRTREERTRTRRRTWFPRLQSFNNFLPSP